MSQVATRAFELLEEVASSPEPLRLMELAERTGIDKSTASRLLDFLEGRELVRRDPETKRYFAGRGLLALSTATLRSSDLTEIVGPHLTALRDETGETVAFHLRVGGRRICVAGAESRHDVRRVLRLGEQLPLCVGPSGKVMLAFLPPAEIETLLEDPACEERELLLGELAQAREQGYLAAIGSRTPGLGAICFPIFGAGAAPVGAMSVGGPELRWTLEAMTAAEARIRAVADELSAIARSGLIARARQAPASRPRTRAAGTTCCATTSARSSRAPASASAPASAPSWPSSSSMRRTSWSRPPPGSPHAYPSACGAPAVAAIEQTALLLAAARAAGALVVQTRLEFRRDGSDIGAYGRKRPLLSSEGWCPGGQRGRAAGHLARPRRA